MGGREIPYTWDYYEDDWESREDEPGWSGVCEDDWGSQYEAQLAQEDAEYAAYMEALYDEWHREHLENDEGPDCD